MFQITDDLRLAERFEHAVVGEIEDGWFHPGNKHILPEVMPKSAAPTGVGGCGGTAETQCRVSGAHPGLVLARILARNDLGRGLPTSSPSANLTGRWRILATRRPVSADQAAPGRGAHSLASRTSRTSLPGHRPCGAVVRRLVVGGVRHRSDSARAAHRRPGGARV